jgi:hypothetical protein
MKHVKKVVQVQYHRNGVGGAGFTAVLFTSDAAGHPSHTDNSLFLGIVHDEPGYCSVVRVEDLSDARGVTFGVNSWRGDNFEPELRAAIEEANDTGRVFNFAMPVVRDDALST